MSRCSTGRPQPAADAARTRVTPRAAAADRRPSACVAAVSGMRVASPVVGDDEPHDRTPVDQGKRPNRDRRTRPRDEQRREVGPRVEQGVCLVEVTDGKSGRVGLGLARARSHDGDRVAGRPAAGSPCSGRSGDAAVGQGRNAAFRVRTWRLPRRRAEACRPLAGRCADRRRPRARGRRRGRRPRSRCRRPGRRARPACAGQRRAHRRERPRRREALAETAEVDRRAGFDPRPARAAVDIDRAPAAPAVERRGRAIGRALEGAVVAGGDERGKDRRVELPAGVDRAQATRRRGPR